MKVFGFGLGDLWKLKKASDQFERDKKMQNYEWQKSLKAGVTQILTLILTAIIAAVFGVLSDSENIKTILLRAGVNEAYVVVILMLIAGGLRVAQNWMKHSPNAPWPSSGDIPAVVALLLLPALASPTFAQEPTPQPAPEYSLSTGGVSVVTTGVKHEYFAARLSLKAILNQRDSIHSRVTLTGSQDGGSLEFGDPATFRSVVPEIEYRRSISDAVAFAILGNVTFSAEGEQGKPIDPRMFTGCAGFRGALKDSTWLQVSGCFAGPVGSKPALGVRGGRSIGNGEAWFDFTLPVQADALRNKAWVLSVGSTLTVAHGQVR